MDHRSKHQFVNEKYFLYISINVYKSNQIYMEHQTAALQSNQAFIQQEKKSFRQLISTLLHLLAIDWDIFPFLCHVQQPHIPQFWKLISKLQRIVRGTQKTNILTMLASLFYRIYYNQSTQESTIPNQIIFSEIQAQYTKVLQSIAQIPKIIKKCQQIDKIKRILQQTHDVCLVLQVINCLKKNGLIYQDYDKQNQIFQWKIQASQILIGKALNKNTSIKIQADFSHKNNNIQNRSFRNTIGSNITNKENLKQSKTELLKFLRKTKQLAKQSKINKTLLLKIYKNLLYYSIKFSDQNIPFLQLQAQNFKKCFSLTQKQQRQLNLLLDKCLMITKKKVNLLVQQAWGPINCFNQNKQNQALHRTYRKKSIRQKFLLQTSELIFRFDAQKREQINQKRKIACKSLHKNGQSPLNRKRVGFITNRNSITKKVKIDAKNNEAYSTTSFKVQYRRNIYQAVGQITIKQPAITNEDLIFEMQNFKNRVIESPLITDDQILLQSKNRKMNKTRSLKFRGRTQSMENCILGDSILSYFQVFGNEFYQFQIYEQERSEDQAIGIGFKIHSEYAPTYQVCFQSGRKLLFYEQFKKYVTNSQLYFELMQQRLEQPIQITETQFFSACFCYFTSRVIDRNETNLLISLVKMLRLYFYWYYTQVSKINGIVMGKRPNIKITDSLKFSIALQFLRKNNLKSCLGQFNNVRNKVGLLQCFQYLSSGRQMLVKAFIRHHLQVYICTFILDSNSYNSFVIDPRKKTMPYFKKISIYQILYNPLSCQIQNQRLFQHSNYFTEHQIARIMLSNIIHKYIPKKQVKKFLASKTNFQAQFIVSQEKKLNFQITVQQEQDEDGSIFSISRSKPMQLTIKKDLSHFLPILKIFSQIYNQSFNYSLRGRSKQCIQIYGQHYLTEQYRFGGNIQLDVFEFAKRAQAKYVYLDFLNLKFNSASSKIFDIIKGPYHNKIGVQIDRKNAIFRLNSVKKNIKQQYCKKNFRSIAKTLIKAGVNNYIYVAVTENIQFKYFRFQVYFPIEQRKFFTILNYEKVLNDNAYVVLHQKILRNFDKKMSSETINKQVQNDQLKIMLKNQFIMWKRVLKHELKICYRQSYIKLLGQQYLLFETFGSLQFIDHCSLQGEKIQLVQIQATNKLCYMIHEYKQYSQCAQNITSDSKYCAASKIFSKIFVGEPDENPFSYSMNLFADHICKQYKVNLYTDLLVRLYSRLINSQLMMSSIKVAQLSNIDYFT